MRLGIRTRLVTLMAVIIFIMLLGYTVNYVQVLKSQYLQGIQWQSEALASSLLMQIHDLETHGGLNREQLSQELENFSAECQRLYEISKEKHVTHIAILDENGKILSHDNQELEGHELPSILADKLGTYRTIVAYDEEAAVYHTMVSILDTNNIYLGVLDIGFSGEVLDNDLRVLRNKAITLLLVFLLVSSSIIFVAVHLIVTKPIRYLAKVGERLAEGYPIHKLKVAQRNDEIALLGSVFIRISDYISEITDVARNVATGALTSDVRKRSKRDALGVALQEMLTYLQAVARIASKIAEGDLTVIPFLRSDIDAFGRSMRDMISGLQSLIRQIRVSSEQISNTGTNLAELSTRDMDIVQSAQTGVEEVISIMTELGLSVEEVAHDMELLSASAEETSASVSSMTQSITNIAASTTDLAGQTQNAMAELNKSTDLLKEVTGKAVVSSQLSQETIEDALEGQQAVEEVTVSMDTIQQTNLSTVETITRFEQQTQDIGTILDVIDEITDQSSLLALNASIIAAQAGSHGRGFAVIADEMRNLATKVSSSTKDIGAIVKIVQEETGAVVKKIHGGTADIVQGVKRTQQARKVLQKIFTSAQRSSAVVTEITEAIQKMQETTSNQMKSVMKRVESMTTEITQATMEQKSSTIQINQIVEHIAHMAVRTQQATTEQLQGVQRVLESVDRVRMLSDQNLQSSEQIDRTAVELTNQAHILLQSVDRFKLGRSETISDETPSKNLNASEEDGPKRQALKK